VYCGAVHSAEKEDIMTTTTSDRGPHSLGDSLRALRAKWGWIVALGVIFMIAGVIALGSVVAATASAVLIVGVMMIMAGVAEIIAAFNVKDWGKFAVWMLLGVLYVAAGVICFLNPFAAATVLTLMLGFALVVGGIVRMFLAWHMREAGKPWGWVVVSGIISLLLGLMIIAQWPASSFFVLGIFLGIDLIFIGSGWIAIGMALRQRAARA
jgi:uncharacterized membrane protein HdeD (DUF308 family)